MMQEPKQQATSEVGFSALNIPRKAYVGPTYERRAIAPVCRGCRDPLLHNHRDFVNCILCNDSAWHTSCIVQSLEPIHVMMVANSVDFICPLCLTLEHKQRYAAEVVEYLQKNLRIANTYSPAQPAVKDALEAPSTSNDTAPQEESLQREVLEMFSAANLGLMESQLVWAELANAPLSDDFQQSQSSGSETVEEYAVIPLAPCCSDGWWCRGSCSVNRRQALLQRYPSEIAEALFHLQKASCKDDMIPCFVCNREGFKLPSCRRVRNSKFWKRTRTFWEPHFENNNNMQ